MASMIRMSVTSLGRTWPSTIFWRAVEKSDIGGLRWHLIQGLPKRDMTTGASQELEPRAYGRGLPDKRNEGAILTGQRAFPGTTLTRENRPISSFASPSGFVIRSALR